ncbi:putative L-aspartate oxidase [Helianthus annuus]|nr:putative L-aspartate oxidase [Helianthus annuus]
MLTKTFILHYLYIYIIITTFASIFIHPYTISSPSLIGPRFLLLQKLNDNWYSFWKCQSTAQGDGLLATEFILSGGLAELLQEVSMWKSRGACDNLQIKRYVHPNSGTRRPFQTLITSSIRDHSTKYFDFAVIGSGVAGLRYALEVAKHGTVAVITKAEPHESNTNYAQGGVSAVLCPSDSVESHVQDTMVAGAYLCDEETVRVVCTEGPERIRELIAMGASFDHGEDGNLHLAREGGHSHRRIVHAADMTGREIERALLKAIESDPNISVFKHHFAIDLLTSQDGSETVCHGVDTMNTKTHKVLRFISKVTLLASGGAGHIYPSTTNPPVATGDGIAMAHRAQAIISNMEFVQFHPTALADEGLPITPLKTRENAFLITEAVRGDGGLLYNLDMERFMPMYDERAELAPRDVVARSIDDQLKKRDEKYVLLDISHKSRDKILLHFPNIAAECLKYGLDITRDPIPVVPAAHYMCGGVRAGLQGETNVRGLYVAGEVACTGLHGANRLASNSLLEALVFAQRAVKPSIDHMKGSHVDQTISRWWDPPVIPMQLGCTILDKIINRTKEVRKELKSIMWEHVGIVRSTTRLMAAEQRIGELELEWEAYLFQQGWEPTMVGLEACEMRNLFCCAKLVLTSALTRHESRGLHYTTDFPHVDERSRLPTIIVPCSNMNRTWSSRQLHKQQIC